MSRSKTPEREKFTVEEAARIAAYFGGDGHSIYNIGFVDTVGGICKAKVVPFNVVHQSVEDGTGKHVINGDRDLVLRGVYALTIQEAACRDIGGTLGDFHGRGRRAQWAHAEIKRIAKEHGVRWPIFDDAGVEIGVEFPVSTGQVCHSTDTSAEPE
jgi:hypothetical protein